MFDVEKRDQRGHVPCLSAALILFVSLFIQDVEKRLQLSMDFTWGGSGVGVFRYVKLEPDVT